MPGISHHLALNLGIDIDRAPQDNRLSEAQSALQRSRPPRCRAVQYFQWQ